MREFCRRLIALPVLAIAVVLVGGCPQRSPEEKVASQRGRYYAELNGFVVKQEPLIEPELAAEAVEGEEEVATEPEEGAEAEEAGITEIDLEPMPSESDIILDIVVRHDAFDKLPGITLDVSMVDSQKVEKGHWKVWVDTADLEKGPGKQVTHILEDVPYEEGDGLLVEVRQPVPPEELSEYREFALATE